MTDPTSRPSPTLDALGRLGRRLLADPDVNALLRALADLSGDPAPKAEPVPSSVVSAAPAPPAPPAPRLSPPPISLARREPLAELTLGRPTPSLLAAAPSFPTTYRDEGPAEDDLHTVADRCRLKAEGVRWAVERARRLEGGADFRDEVAPGDREIVDRARALPNCYLWMNQPHATQIPADPKAAEDLAKSYEVAAIAAGLLKELEDESAAPSPLLGQVLESAAEAQSALRVAANALNGPKDVDQFALYDYLRKTAEFHRIYIRRFMRIDDPADPLRLPALEQRLKSLAEAVDDRRGKVKSLKRRLSQLKYHAGLIRENGGGEPDWRKAAEAIDALVADGVPPSALEIRQQLLPILDILPDDLGEYPKGFDIALREADYYRSTLPAPTAEPAPPEPTAAVAEVARLLEGRTVVFIGGTPRPGAREALRSAFRLEEFDWIVTRDHQSIESFEYNIARPNVALVIVAIRWSNHSFGDVKVFCDRHGKPLVRLTAGYNPNQVAAQILAQCSGMLAAEHGAATA